MFLCFLWLVFKGNTTENTEKYRKTQNTESLFTVSKSLISPFYTSSFEMRHAAETALCLIRFDIPALTLRCLERVEDRRERVLLFVELGLIGGQDDVELLILSLIFAERDPLMSADAVLLLGR